jgi:hypothetical protein
MVICRVVVNGVSHCIVLEVLLLPNLLKKQKNFSTLFKEHRNVGRVTRIDEVARIYPPGIKLLSLVLFQPKRSNNISIQHREKSTQSH